VGENAYVRSVVWRSTIDADARSWGGIGPVPFPGSSSVVVVRWFEVVVEVYSVVASVVRRSVVGDVP